MPHHLRAPVQHGDILVSPKGSLSALTRANEAAMNPQSLWGRPLSRLREQARAEVYSLATRYTNEVVGPPSVGTASVAIHSANDGLPEHRLGGNPSFSTGEDPRNVEQRAVSIPDATSTPIPSYWVIGGHQPELFHPGVWLKNAVVAGLATQLDGVGLNLIVDNDVCTESAVRIPSRFDSAVLTSLEWDVPRPPSPWEERPRPDADLFANFGDRCREHLRPWGIEPLAAGQDWRASPDRGIVDRLVQLRARFERPVGVRNLELKVSDLSDTQCFRLFLLGSLRDAPQLFEAYNTSLAEYREINRIRSRSHPVPPLEATADGIEVPFWVWRAGEARRGRLFVEVTGPVTLRLHDGSREVGLIPTHSEAVALQALGEFRQQGWKIRPRALTLTLFSRVCLGSIFVHGIGGAKYDELTDALMQRWLGLMPPQIIVATATWRLFERFAGPPLESEIVRLKRELRSIRWNPELVQAGAEIDAQTQALREEKSALLAPATASVTDPATRHARLQSLNTALRQTLTAHEQQVRHHLQQLLAALPHQQSLHSREFSANLFPAEVMQDLLHRARDACGRFQS